MCFYRYYDIELDDAPPPKKKAEKPEYVMVSSKPHWKPRETSYPSPHQPMIYTSSAPVADTGHVKWYGQTTSPSPNVTVNSNNNNNGTKPGEKSNGGEPITMIPLMPTTPDPKQQFYCKELDGSFSLRTVDDIGKNAGPGFWRYGSGGWPYYTRT